MHTQYIIAFSAYFAILFAIGLASHRAQKTAKDFIMGNRSLGYWVTAFSAHASDMSAWLFMAFPAAILIGGVSQAWIGVGLLLGMLCNWQFVAKRLREQTETYESYTLSTFFENKFQDGSGVIRVVTALMTLFFTTSYLAAALIAMGYLLESLFGIDYYVGLSVAMFVATTYTFIGGYYTIAKVDQFQAIFLLVMILIVPVVGFFYLSNGFQTIFDQAAIQNISLNLFHDNAPMDLDKYVLPKGVIAIVLLILGWGLGYFGQPHIITKFMGIKCPNEIKKSKYVGMTWQFITLGSAVVVGLVGIGFFEGSLANPELVFVSMVKVIFNPLIAGFILCGVLAANISTMDSQILVCASVLSEDLYKHIFKKHASDKELLIVSRLGVVLVAIVSLALAFAKSTTVLEAVLYAWSGLGSSFGPLVLMSLYFKKCNRYGAIAGIVVGGVVAGVWPTVNSMLIDYKVPSMVPGFALSLLSIYLVSIITDTKAKTKTAM
jgi:sodium/proline symporter